MPFTRQQVLDRLRARIDEGVPIIGGGAGTGISAKCEEAGGIDLIVIYNSGRYRMAGRGSLAGLMPYGDANAVVMEMAGEVLTIARDTPVLAGVCASDPFRRMEHFLLEVKEIGFAGVSRLDPQREVHLATDACAYPNGLALSPDASILSVAISRLDQRCFEEEQQGAVCTHRRIRTCDVAPDGRLSNNRMFCAMSSADPGVPDGLTVDTVGRVLCVGSGGIWVIAQSGEVIGVIRTSEVVRNLAFGGPDFRTLYLTPGGSLSKLEVKTPGIGPRS